MPLVGSKRWNPLSPAGPSTTGVPAMVLGWVAAFLCLDTSSSLDIYSIARNEREEVDDNMFPVLCFVQRSSRQHVCVCRGLRVPLSAASKQGSSQFSKAYSPPSNTALTLETVYGFDTLVGFSTHIPVPKIPWHEWQVVLGSCWREAKPITEPLGLGWSPGPSWQLPLAWPPAGDRLGLQHPPTPTSIPCCGMATVPQPGWDTGSCFLSAFMVSVPLEARSLSRCLFKINK